MNPDDENRCLQHLQPMVNGICPICQMIEENKRKVG